MLEGAPSLLGCSSCAPLTAPVQGKLRAGHEAVATELAKEGHGIRVHNDDVAHGRLDETLLHGDVNLRGGAEQGQDRGEGSTQ